MNGARQEPLEAAGTGVPTLDLAGAGRNDFGRAALGIKAKLFLAFGGMAVLTVCAGAVA